VESAIFDKSKSPLDSALLFVVLQHNFRIDRRIIAPEKEPPQQLFFVRYNDRIERDTNIDVIDPLKRFILFRPAPLTGTSLVFFENIEILQAVPGMFRQPAFYVILASASHAKPLTQSL
jgi:hypothetical protein